MGDIYLHINLLYESFNKCIDDKFSWSPTEKTKESINRFIQRLDKRGVKVQSLGLSYLYDYFTYSFNFWTKDGEDLRCIPFNWIIGEPQYLRWINRSEHYHFYCRTGILSKVDLPKLSELKSVLYTDNIPKLDYSEELEKERFFNTNEGFVNCILLTTLYSKSSKWCIRCKFKTGCKQELVARDSKLALSRGIIKL